MGRRLLTNAERTAVRMLLALALLAGALTACEPALDTIGVTPDPVDRGDDTALQECGTAYATPHVLHTAYAGGASGAPDTLIVEGIVSADLRGAERLRGFFLQDPLEPRGIFVFAPPGSPAADANFGRGDRLRLHGGLGDYQGALQLVNARDIAVCARGQPLEPTPLRLPLEAHERDALLGAYVRLEDDLTLVDTYDLARFGTVRVAAGGRLFHPLNGNEPGDPEWIRAANLARGLLLDDGSAVQNPARVPFLRNDRTPRAGDTLLAGVTGVLWYGRPAGFAASGAADYRLHVLEPHDVAFRPDNPRAPPPFVDGELTVAGFNVLNLFVTLASDDSPARGARDEDERLRQRAKLVAALSELDADIVALVEMENEGVVQAAAGLPLAERRSAVDDLVAALNDAYGRETYRAMRDPEYLGGDAIRNAILYKPERVAFLASASDGDRVHNRAPVAGSFRQASAPFAPLTVIAVHHKSKRCTPDATGADAPAPYGGCFGGLRERQTQALLRFIDDLRADRWRISFLVAGDLNAYALEAPIALLEGAALENLTRRLDDADRYSYVFEGESGTLDYAFVTPELSPFVRGFGIWHANADEARVLEYDAVRYGPVERLQDDSPYRASDHDPVLVGLALPGEGSADALVLAIARDIELLLADGLLAMESARGLLDALDEGVESGGSPERDDFAAFRERLAELRADGALTAEVERLWSRMADAADRLRGATP